MLDASPRLTPPPPPGLRDRARDRRRHDSVVAPGPVAAAAGGPGAAPAGETGEFGYRPALDGLRAIAVIAVLFFHARFTWARGGFLGVSTFFTLSGFLITTLLLSESRRSGSISLRAFWTRRFRRLLPAAWSTIALVVLAGLGGAWNSDQLRALRGDVPAAFLQVLNWHYVLGGRSYGDKFAAPSPLEHFWSLAIEEQYYLLFPIVVVAVMRWGRGRRWILGTIMAGVAAASSIASAVTSRHSVPRAYFGTDTRLAELAVGVVLAVVVFGRWGPWSAWLRRGVTTLAVVALGASVWTWATATVESPWLYPWGLLATMGCSVALIVAAVQPGPARVLLSLAPLRWIGAISYGLYLFHWPVFLWLTPTRTGLGQWPLFGLRLVVTFALAAGSHRFVEDPVRRGRLLARRGPRRVVVPTFVVGVAIALLVSTADLPGPDAIDRAGPADLAAVPPPPTRVLVVGDQLAASLGVALTAAKRDDLSVTVDADPWCGVVNGGFVQLPDGTVERDSERCRTRRPRWEATEAAGRPDVVVVWAGIRDVFNRRLSVLEPWAKPGDAALDDLIRTEVGATVAALQAGGATVVWLTAPPVRDTRTPPPIPPPVPGEPGHGEYQQLSLEGAALDAPPAGYAQNDDSRIARWNELATAEVRAHHGLVLDAAGYMAAWPAGPLDPTRRVDGVGVAVGAGDEFASWLAPTITGISRAATPPPPQRPIAADDPLPVAPTVTPRRVIAAGQPVRTLVVGDSVALNVGYGLELWRQAEPGRDLVVGNGGQLGCAVARGGSYRYLNEVNTLGERCNWAAESLWPRMVASVDPDVAVIVSGIWEVADRLLPGDTKWRHVGDPVFDHHYLSELLSAIDFLGAGGATVVLVTYPHIQAGRDQGFTDLPESDPTRIDRLNALTTRAAALRPGVARVVDFQAWLASTPGGELDLAKRSDGVHFEDAWAPNIGAWLGPQLITMGRGEG